MLNMAQRDKIKMHFQENKNVYIAVGVTAVVAVAGTLIFVKFNSNTGTQVAQKITQIGFRNESNPVQIVLQELSTPSKPLHLVGSSQYFNSIHDAARQTGYSVAQISKNANNLISSLNGVDNFEFIDLAA